MPYNKSVLAQPNKKIVLEMIKPELFTTLKKKKKTDSVTLK